MRNAEIFCHWHIVGICGYCNLFNISCRLKYHTIKKAPINYNGSFVIKNKINNIINKKNNTKER